MQEGRKNKVMDKGIFIIAEAGVNHNGDINIAKRLVDAASESRADAVKFQTFIGEKFISSKAEKAEYQKKTVGETGSQLDMIKKLELPQDAFRVLKEYCEKKKIKFMSTAFDIDSAKFLNDIGVDVFKIPSGEITNYPLLKVIGQFKKRVIMSTGMSEIPEIKAAIDILKQYGTNDISVLHCNTQYPTPMEDVNLKAMQQLRNELDLPIGYSDHTLGIEVPIAAAALGAEIIEKHFTMDRNMEGPDHRASLEPDELKKMVEGIRNIEKALGDGIKRVSPSEKENILTARKSIVATMKIQEGDRFTEENLTTKRPGSGISPMMWEKLIGKKAKREYNQDDLIYADELEA